MLFFNKASTVPKRDLLNLYSFILATQLLSLIVKHLLKF